MNNPANCCNAYLRMVQETDRFVDFLTDALVFELEVNPYFQTWNIVLGDLEAESDRKVIRSWVIGQPETDIRASFPRLVEKYKRRLMNLYGGHPPEHFSD